MGGISASRMSSSKSSADECGMLWWKKEKKVFYSSFLSFSTLQSMETASSFFRSWLSSKQPEYDQEVVLLPSTFQESSHLASFVSPILGVEQVSDIENFVIEDRTKFTIKYAEYGGRVFHTIPREADAFEHLRRQKPGDPVHLALLVTNGTHTPEKLSDYTKGLKKNMNIGTQCGLVIVLVVPLKEQGEFESLLGKIREGTPGIPLIMVDPTDSKQVEVFFSEMKNIAEHCKPLTEGRVRGEVYEPSFVENFLKSIIFGRTQKTLTRHDSWY